MNGCLMLFLFGLALVALFVALAAQNRARKLEDEMRSLKVTLDALRRAVFGVPAAAAAPPKPAETAAAPATAATPATPPPTPPPAPAPHPSPAVVKGPPYVVSPPVQPPVTDAAGSPTAGQAAFATTPQPPAASAPPPVNEHAFPPATQPVAPPPPPPPPPPAIAPATPPPPPPATPPPPPPPPYHPPLAAPRPAAPRFDWEGLVGVKLFSWIAGIALVLAAVFFLKYTVENGWVTPAVRAIIGLLTGTTLLVVCELRVARDYKFTANALLGAGIAILYATLFAMHALWHLVPSAVVFALMILVTAVAVALSIRRDSIFIALLGLVGGFATPALLSSGENRPFGLFGYLLLLNAGLSWVAYKKRWPLLSAASLGFTVFYEWAWINSYLTKSQFPLAVGIFVVFALMATITLWVKRSDEQQSRFDRISVAGAALPLLFGAYAAATPAYGTRYNLLFGFLLLICTGLAVIAARRGPQWLHLLGGIAVLLTTAVWLGSSYTPGAWPAILGWVAAFVLLYLAADFAGAHASPVAGVLLFVFPVLAGIEPKTASTGLLFGVLFALLAAIGAHAIARRVAAAYYIAAICTVAVEAIWSANHLSNEHLLSGLGIYLAFALYFIGVPALSRRLGRPFGTRGGGAAVLFASLALLFFLAGGSVADATLWGLAMMIGILNVGMLIEARWMKTPLVATIGMLLSWIVIGVWWATASLTVQIFPALVVAGGFSLLILGGSIWAQRGTDDRAFGNSTALALVGHFFLLFVAAQPGLVNPPWPMLAVLFVLDAALAVAALYSRKGKLLIAGSVASQVVLAFWVSNASLHPFVLVACMFGIAAIAAIAFGLATRLGIEAKDFALAFAAALFVGQIIPMTARFLPYPLSLASQLLLVVFILLLAAITEWHVLPVIAVLTTAVVTACAADFYATWQLLLGYSAVVWAPFCINPLLLGRRVRKDVNPYLAAVLGTVAFFLYARTALMQGGFEPYIGALPIALAIVMMALLYNLLRIEPPGQRLLSRLALVAAAALAFVTVAIPLQLEKQWMTIGWALEAAALVWLFNRIPHRGLLLWAGGLFAAVFVRLTVNHAIFGYHATSHRPIVNWYLYTYLIAAATFFLGARLLPQSEQRARPWALPALNTAGTILLFYLVNIEIADFFSTGPAFRFQFFSAPLKQDLTYTLAWAIFALLMLIAGIWLNTRSARVAAIVLLLVTILKCFFLDLGRLAGLYRVVSLLGLAVALVAVGVLLQRFVIMKTAPPPEESTP